MCRARIHKILAQKNYIEAFHYTTSCGDQIEVYRTNFQIAIDVIGGFDLKEAEKEEFILDFSETDMNEAHSKFRLPSESAAT